MRESGLILTRNCGEKIIIIDGEDNLIEVTLTKVMNSSCSLRINAPKHISVDREEIYKKKNKTINSPSRIIGKQQYFQKVSEPLDLI